VRDEWDVVDDVDRLCFDEGRAGQKRRCFSRGPGCSNQLLTISGVETAKRDDRAESISVDACGPPELRQCVRLELLEKNVRPELFVRAIPGCHG
jgi:hypothetical protein